MFRYNSLFIGYETHKEVENQKKKRTGVEIFVLIGRNKTELRNIYENVQLNWTEMFETRTAIVKVYSLHTHTHLLVIYYSWYKISLFYSIERIKRVEAFVIEINVNRN